LYLKKSNSCSLDKKLIFLSSSAAGPVAELAVAYHEGERRADAARRANGGVAFAFEKSKAKLN
jgi:hypothetical protein